jgi:hypothetical protein
MESGKWKMENGKWKMESGKLKVGNWCEAVSQEIALRNMRC